ncbi:L-lactate dehydrogenase [Bartonella sp. DGB1]|uniref:alpha-hydroxy acid oxidase n=1 Tax=Bartonella sp. DGB1 TaxID=3239807 RepID=UPI0035269498
MSLKQLLTIADLKKQAKDKVPRMFFDYVDSGSWSESTYNNNEEAYKNILFSQKVLTDISQRSTATTMIGQKVTMPVALAPSGFAGMQYADGEMLAVQAANEFGVPFCLSTMSICSLEDVASVTNSPFWFQLYMMKDRNFMQNLIERAKQVKCSALILTVDLQVLGQRHKDIKNGLSAPPKINFDSFLQFATRPRWCWQMLKTRRHSFGNIVGYAKDVSDLSSLSSWIGEQFDPALSWNDVEWVKKLWNGPLIIKGIMRKDDAIAAVNSGADALTVSNHGGRQLDGAPASIDLLPEIVETVGNDIEVHIDGGIRSGQDVLRALALGAKGTYIGRPWLYGLGAAGKAGVTRALEIIHTELDITMGLTGKTNIKEINSDIIYFKK